MELHVALGQRGRWSEDIYAQLRAAILDGRLRPGEAVPATRALAARLEVSRNTVMNAYERLIAEGFLTGTHGAGTFVRDQGPPIARRDPSLEAGGRKTGSLRSGRSRTCQIRGQARNDG